MKKKKTVTLPRVFNPGKGHPKETLAYLNPAEHALIKQLTDGKANRGPMGVRSYAVETGTTTNSTSGGGSTTGGGGSKGPNGGPGGGSLQAPNRTAPSANVNSGVIGSKGGGASTQKPGAGENAGPADVKTVAKTAQSLKDTRTTAMGKVASAAQANADKYPSRGSYTSSPSYGRDLGAVFNTEMRDIGKPNDYLDNSRLSFDRWATGAVGNLYGQSPRSVSDMARTIAGEAANQTPEQRAAVANVMNNRLGLGSGYLGGGTVPGMLRGFDANGFDAARVGGPNSAFSNAVPGTENYTNGLKALSDAMNPGSTFSQTAPAGVMNATHYYNPADASPSWAKTPSFQATRTAFGDHVFGNPENTVRDVMAARGNLPGGTQVAGIANAGLGEAAALDRAKKAAAAAAAMQNLRPMQGPNMPPQAIPAPNSIGIMPSPSVFAKDPRVGLPQGGFPAATPRSAAGTYTSPYDIQPASAPPRNPSGGMSYTPDLPGPMPAKTSVVTDPRVALTPLGSLPAAKPKDVQVAWNVPPMGGAVPSAYGDLFGTWGVNRPQPKGPAANPGTIHTQTAEATPPAAGWKDWVKQKTGVDVQNAVETVQKKVDEAKPMLKFAQEHPTLAQIGLKMMMGGGGNMPGNLGTAQENSDWYMKPQPPQAPVAPQMADASSEAMSALQSLQQLQANMVAQGASPEDLAYIQSIIDELTNTQVA